MKNNNNLKLTKKIGAFLTASLIGFSLANFSSRPVKARAENNNDTSIQCEVSEDIMVKSIARPTNPTNTLEYEQATDDNILGDASNWNGFILGDVTSAIDFEGSIAIKGNLNANGLSVNTVANDVYHQNTDDITLLVGGDININGYGSVWGNTATSNETVTNYNLSNVTQSEQTTQGEFIVVDSDQYFKDAEKTLKEANKTIASKEANANYTHNGYGSYNFEGNSDTDELVYTVSESDFHNYDMNFNINDGQKVVVNLISNETINFSNGSVSINGNKDDRYLRNNSDMITFNVVNSNEINMTSTSLYGTFLAPNSDLNGNAANICGTTVVNNLDAQNGFELHVPKPTPVPVITPNPIVTPMPVVTPGPIITPDPIVSPRPTVRPPQEEIPKTADITHLLILKDLLLMTGAAYGAKKVLCKKK